MTTQNVSPGAALPPDQQPQSFDLVAARKQQEQQTTAVAGAAREAAKWTGVLRVGPGEYPENRLEYALVESLSAFAMVALQEAQDGGKLRDIIVAIKELVVEEQREQLVGQMLDPAPVKEWAMTVEDCIDVLSDGMEQIAARPRTK